MWRDRKKNTPSAQTHHFPVLLSPIQKYVKLKFEYLDLAREALESESNSNFFLCIYITRSDDSFPR